MGRIRIVIISAMACWRSARVWNLGMKSSARLVLARAGREGLKIAV